MSMQVITRMMCTWISTGKAVFVTGGYRTNCSDVFVGDMGQRDNQLEAVLIMTSGHYLWAEAYPSSKIRRITCTALYGDSDDLPIADRWLNHSEMPDDKGIELSVYNTSWQKAGFSITSGYITNSFEKIAPLM